MGDAKGPPEKYRRTQSDRDLSSHKAVGSGLAARLDFIN